MLASRRCIRCAYRQSLICLRQRRQRYATGAKHLQLGHILDTVVTGSATQQEPFKQSRRVAKASHRVEDIFARSTPRGGGGGGGGGRRATPRRSDDNQIVRRTSLRKIVYTDLLKNQLREVEKELKDGPVSHQMQQHARDADDMSKSFAQTWKEFAAMALGANDDDSASPRAAGLDDPRAKKLRADILSAYRQRGEKAVPGIIKQAFYHDVFGSRFTDNDIRNQMALADLRYPSEWYPATRAMHRTVHMHVGPTNSGKTYHALRRLEQAQTGLYAGPLRLLAHEVYTRMNAKGKPCNLVTGEERRLPTVHGDDNDPMQNRAGNCNMSSCTVEMVPLNRDLDVAVIDEIQMIGNADRGWAWTQALLGVKAKEVHLCGEERAVPIIKQICASNGDQLEIHRYERLSPLKMADRSLDGDLGRLRKGDCVVSFSVMGIHALRKQIEQRTGRKVATVYGSLPPETRAQQARLFNDPNNDYDFLVASDAVGMGLNLAIRRIVFESSSKFDGFQRRTLPIADIKQIAGRAGRYRTAEQSNHPQAASEQELAAAKGDSPLDTVDASGNGAANVGGIVTTLDQFDFPIVAAAMQSEPKPIKTAGIFPPSSITERFASYFPPGTPFSYTLMRLHELSQMHSRFHLCGLKDFTSIADTIEPVKGLSISDRNVICAAPAGYRDGMWRELMPAYARAIAEQTNGHLADFEELPLEILEAPVSPSRDYLRGLEDLHKAVVCYLWLSYRFAGVFTTRALAFHVKLMVEERIEEVLDKFSFSETKRRKMAEHRQKQLLRDMLEPASVDELDAHGNVMERDSDDAADGESIEENDGVERTAEELHGHQVEDEQTSLTAGGDHFGGEDELELSDPSDRDALEEEPAAARTFAEWRARQQRKLESWHGERRQDSADDLVSAFDVSEQEARSLETPTVQEAMPELAAEADEENAAMSPEQSGNEMMAPVTPETDVGDNESPMASQVVPPTPDDVDRPIDLATPPQPRENQFSGGIVPKHLECLQSHATEMERNAASRP